jgi:hypothetical protein
MVNQTKTAKTMACAKSVALIFTATPFSVYEGLYAIAIDTSELVNVVS